MIPFDDALDRILATSRPQPLEKVVLNRALGRFLASDLVARVDSPPFDNSAVDGFAVASSEVHAGTSLQITGAMYAGDRPDKLTVIPGTTVRTMTGAPIPQGADAMVMQEDVSVDEQCATFSSSVKKGQAVRKKREDYATGDLLLAKGSRLTSPALAIVASQGLSEVETMRPPTMAIIVTGSELRLAGDALLEGQIYESNSVGLAARAAQLGIPSVTTVRVEDDEDATRTALLSAMESHDIVVFTGGASVGEKDYVRSACLAAGVQEAFWKIDMKPGKPVFFGTRGTNLVFALPGNPVSAQVTFLLLVAPAVRAMMGARQPVPSHEMAVLGACLARTPGRLEFVRATTLYDGPTLKAFPLAKQGSHQATGLAMADRLIVVPSHIESIEAGTIVETVPIEGGLL